jgi:hypothetical protein
LGGRRYRPARPLDEISSSYFSTYSGGTYCCTFSKIATSLPSGRWKVIDGGENDVLGYKVKDLDGDGSWELVSYDDSFHYAFDDAYGEASHAIRISQLRAGVIKDVTSRIRFRHEVRNFLRRIEGHADKEPKLWSSKGFLAAWVATKINLGEGRAAWAKMLKNFERSIDLAECRKTFSEPYCPEKQESRRTFPEALKRHLVNHGYKMNFAGLKME